nr:IS1380 family transposase [Bacteroidota bacterium]
MGKDNINSANNTTKHENPPQLSLFNLSNLDHKKVEASFTLKQTSNDGGLLLLREMDNLTGIIDRLSTCLEDARNQSYVQHSYGALLRQRIMQIAAGYEDANDCNTMKDDEILKICSESSQTLSSQPTMSRFENQVSSTQLYRIAKSFVDHFISSYQSEPGIIILDSDDTSSLTYGNQQLTLFNNYYGDYCYMPLHIYEGFSGKLITTILKPGRRSKSLDVFTIHKRIISYLREHWPNTMIILRGDSHFCSKEMMEWACGMRNVEFITGLTGNSVLNDKAKVTIESAQREFKQYGKAVKRFHCFQYKAGSWAFPERVVVKVEVSSMGTNVRYIVSSLQNIRSRALYEQGYCIRGAAELRIKDHKTYLKSDRMSCNSFKANQFRLFLHSAAYVLIHSLQNEILQGTEFCKATMRTIQLKVIKVAAQVKVLKSKIKIELPASFYSQNAFVKCFQVFEILRL